MTPAANRAEEEFERVFRDHDLPSEIAEFVVDSPASIVALLVGSGMAGSNNEARRLVVQGGVRLGNERITSTRDAIEVTGPVILQVGRRRFARLIPRS